MLDMYRTAMRFPEMTRDGPLMKGIGGGVSSQMHHMTLFRSSSYMNESGGSVAKAFRAFKRQAPDGLLVVIHDEMESKLGSVKLRFAGKGKGHNGIRSCMKHLGTEEFARMAIGISRPESRDSAVVTDWVLGKFTSVETRVLQEQSLIQMIQFIDRLT